ncbi:hypothetical protein PR202_ga23119 [Eleusine coracana subsp. coracana]|uniref:Uncharacterized protein n=1 Tax=Eleusine coracana subsp. coracana TaxID=191504 RepID=A0AAV5D5F7_ELECO|nr:hypothetical protein PR202_ga23119 [Eleusine coracana subsp. coracana]
MVQWQSFLCFGIVAGSVAASLAAIVGVSRRAAGSSSWLAGGDGPPHEGAPWSSCWARVRPAWLLAFRATAVVALAAVLVWDLRTYDASIMMYYTEYVTCTPAMTSSRACYPVRWTLLLEIAYFAVATLFSAYGCLMHSGNRAAGETESDIVRLLSGDCADEPGAGDVGYGPQRLECFMQIIYQPSQVSVGAVVLTDVVFWCLIIPFMSSAHFSLNAVMGCMHSFNLAFLLAETALNTLAFPWFRIAYFILWTCLYVIVQWIAHACGLTWWPYPFLSPALSWAPVWYLALALLHFPCYLVYWLIARAKVALLLSRERWL